MVPAALIWVTVKWTDRMDDQIFGDTTRDEVADRISRQRVWPAQAGPDSRRI